MRSHRETGVEPWGRHMCSQRFNEEGSGGARSQGEGNVKGSPWSVRPLGQGQEGGGMGTLGEDLWATAKRGCAPWPVGMANPELTPGSGLLPEAKVVQTVESRLRVLHMRPSPGKSSWGTPPPGTLPWHSRLHIPVETSRTHTRMLAHGCPPGSHHCLPLPPPFLPCRR